MVLRSLFSGVSGLQTHQVRLDVISNNIANVNTTGFKASRVRFADVLSQTTEIATAPESGRGGQNPVQVGLGVTGASITRDMKQGSLELTGRTTDLAIQGNGFFIVRDGENPAEFYTRDGHFDVDADGSLVLASNGYRVQGWNSTFDSVAQEFTIDTSQAVSDVNIDLFQQFQAVATSSIDLGGNLDSRAETALDPITVSWTKNGASREVQIRFIHVDPVRNLFLWRAYDPSTIDSTTGDFQVITTDAAGTEASGIIQLDSNGRVARHYINTADDDATDPATYFLNLSSSTEAPSAPDIWAVARPGSSFNGYDFIVLDTEGDGNNYQIERNSALTSSSSIVNDTTNNIITATWANAPFASQAGLSGSAFPNGFATDGVFQVGVGVAGTAGDPGNDLGVPVQFIEARSNIVATRRLDAATSAANPFIATTPTSTFAQIDDLIVGTNRANPTRSGLMATGPDDTSLTTTGTDRDTIQVFVDGRQYTRVASAAAFSSANSAEFVLDAVNGIIEFNGTIANGVNIVVNYDREIRASNTWATTAATTVAAIGSNILGVTSGAAGAASKTRPNGTVDGGADPYDDSVFWKPGSGGTITLSEGAFVNEAFTEVPYQKSDGTNFVAADLAPNTYAVNPETGAIIFGTYSDGATAVTGAATISAGWSFQAYRNRRDNTGTGAVISGLTNLDNQEGASALNAHGFNDLWRVLELPANGAETGQTRLYLQGDYDGTAGTEDPDANTLAYRPTLGTSTTGTTRAEMNYESDDRVNLIIPNGLTKTPNVNPLTDLSPETFAFAPNINQVTGNNGNNNQADSGDSVAVDVKPAGDYQYTTAIQVFDSLGTPWNLSLKFERIDRNLWLVSAKDPTDSTGQRLAGYRLLAFDANGNFDSANTIPFRSPAAAGTTQSTFTGFYFDPPQAGGAPAPPEGAAPLVITPDWASLVQTATSSDATVISQNGAPPGDLESFSFNDEGFVVALFDNGRTRNLARIALQNFVNPAGLVSTGGNLYRETLNSGKIGGPSRPGQDGLGSIVPGALEASNVDLSVEFVDLIITQRGFQAQSRSITTADQVLQEILTLKR